MKVWDANDGKPFTNIEPPGEGAINDVCVWPASGGPPCASHPFATEWLMLPSPDLRCRNGDSPQRQGLQQGGGVYPPLRYF